MNRLLLALLSLSFSLVCQADYSAALEQERAIRAAREAAEREVMRGRYEQDREIAEERARQNAAINGPREREVRQRQALDRMRGNTAQ